MRKAELRVGVLIDELGGGGAQRSAMLTAGAMHRHGIKATLIAACSGRYARELPADLEVLLLSPDWPRLSSIVPFARNLRRAAKAVPLDVIMTNGFGVTRIALLLRGLGLLPGVGVVVVERNSFGAALEDRFPSSTVRRSVVALSRWLYRKADAIVGVSDGVSRDLEQSLRLPSGFVTTINNPVDADRIRAAINEDVPAHCKDTYAQLRRPVVITTGRLVAQKAHLDLLDAFAALPSSHQGSLVILGDGPLRGALEQQAQSLSIADRVWMPGYVDNPWWFIARSDVFALSSHWEGHPRVLLEALACGIPIVATDCPSGPAEILRSVSNARLVPVGDSAALTEGLINFAQTRNPSATADLHILTPEVVAGHYAVLFHSLATLNSRMMSRDVV